MLLCAGCAVTPAQLDKQLQPVNSQLEQMNRENVEQSMRLSMLENSVQDVLDEVRSSRPGSKKPQTRGTQPTVQYYAPPPTPAYAQPQQAYTPPQPVPAQTGSGYVPPAGHAPTAPPPVVAGKDVTKGQLYSGPVAIKVPPAKDVALENQNPPQDTRSTQQVAPAGSPQAQNTVANTVSPVAPGSPAPIYSPQGQQPNQINQTPQANQTPQVIQPSQPQTKAPVSSEEGAYKEALRTYENRRYKESEAMFASFLEAYPNGRYVPNALYWKGESYFAQQRFPEAIMAFKETAARFPKHQKAADALLKMVMTYKKLGDMDNAALYLRILNEDFPGSEALRRAQKIVSPAQG